MERPTDSEDRPESPQTAIVPETAVETRLLRDPDWIEGAAWGEPRPGHPEGAVAAHIIEVLANIDGLALDRQDRERLRLVALLHDTFKHRVDHDRPRTEANHHGMIARRFAERHLDDRELFDVIELHDEAYNAWVKGSRGEKWDTADARATRLIERLGLSLSFYLRFYRADNSTGSKAHTPLAWFEQCVERRTTLNLRRTPGCELRTSALRPHEHERLLFGPCRSSTRPSSTSSATRRSSACAG